jgi:hypothetical protein
MAKETRKHIDTFDERRQKDCSHSRVKKIESHHIKGSNLVTEECLDCKFQRYVNSTPSGGKHYSKWFTQRK